MTATTNNITPKLGEGIFLVKDVAQILNIDYEKARRWIVGYWDGNLKQHFNYTFGENKSKAINFYSLIEFYTFFKLREAHIGATEIRRLHEDLSVKLGTPYPFAVVQDYLIEDRKYKKFVFVQFADGLFKHDGKEKLYFNFLQVFLDKIEFNDNNIASKFYPLGKDKNIVVDPKCQFGQPTIKDTNIKTQSIFSLYKGGETEENISILYDLSVEKVKDAIDFCQKAA